MTESEKPFADRLLAADPPSGAARDRFRNEVRAMLGKTLTPRVRGSYVLGAVFLLAIALFFTTAASFAPELKNDLIPYVMAYFVVTAIASVLAAWHFFRGFWTGTIRRAGANDGAVAIGVGYIGLLGWLFMLMAKHVPEMLRDDVRVFGLILLVYAAVAWVRHRIAKTEMATNEKLLEIELRLAEIGEGVKSKSM